MTVPEDEVPSQGNRPRTIRILGSLFGFLVLGLLIYFLIQKWSYVGQNYTLRTIPVLVIAAFTFLLITVRGLANYLLFRSLAERASLLVWIALAAASSLVNYLPIPAGLIAKGFFLKRVHNLSYVRFAQGQAVIFVLFMLANGVVGLCTVLLWLGRTDAMAVVAAFALMIASTLPLLAPESAWGPLRHLIARMGGPLLRNSRASWPAIGLCQVAALFLLAGKLQLAFSFGPETPSYGACLVFSAMTIATRFISITPGALGVREFLIGGVAYVLDFDVADAVIASSIDRLIELIILAPLGGLSSWRLTRELAASYSTRTSDRARGEPR